MLLNSTQFAAQDVPYVDKDGREVVVAIVKGSFALDAAGRVVPAAKPVAVRVNDVPFDTGRDMASVQFPSDVADVKLGADLVIVGDAIALKPAPFVDLGVTAQGRAVPLRVHGQRLFYRGSFGIAIGQAVPFERETLMYEKAYGGCTEDLSLLEPSNPVGRGIAHRASDLDGKPAPQIEDPNRPHTSAGDRHPVAGFGAIASYWAPRKDYFGTVDERWKEDRMPLMPVDFDIRYNNCAHPALQFPRLFAPGDRIGVVGMHPDGAVVVDVPEFRLTLTGVYDSGRQAAQPGIDTVLIRPNDRQFEVVARASFPLGRANLLREIRIDHG